MSSEKNWTLKEADEAIVQNLFEVFKIHPILCRLLVQRNVKSYEEAERFFCPRLESLYDPFLMKGMQEAVSRINHAMLHNESVLIYGDYDVDGTSAVATVFGFLKKYAPSRFNIEYYIPDRYKEGYGLSPQGIEYAIQGKFSLIVTLDCGIKSAELIGQAKQAGIDVIVCDHHLPDDMLPDAYAILNPKQAGCEYPFKELSGCGIGLKLIQALSQFWNCEDACWHEYLDLTAVSIAADIVPIDDENRILAFYGVERINNQPSFAIRALRDLAKKNRPNTQAQRPLSITDLVFEIGPKVNAAGRMGDARKAVAMFLAETYQDCHDLAVQLVSDNEDRKEIDEKITQQAQILIADDTCFADRKSTVLYKEDWLKGVVGIVASRLIDLHYRPTVVLTLCNGMVTGSARSVHGFNVYEAVRACDDLLLSYGGHFYAAGMSMKPENVPAFKERFEDFVSKHIQEEQCIPEIEIDAILSFYQIRPKFLNILKRLEPFGPENMRPVFLSLKVNVFQGKIHDINQAHIRCTLQQQQVCWEAIGFGLYPKREIFNEEDLDIVYTLHENFYRTEQPRWQIRILDVRKHDPENVWNFSLNYDSADDVSCI